MVNTISNVPVRSLRPEYKARQYGTIIPSNTGDCQLLARMTLHFPYQFMFYKEHNILSFIL